MIYQLKHTSTYDYSAPVARSQQLLHLTPRNTPAQRRLHEAVTLNPAPTERSTYLDYFGNTVQYANIVETHGTLVVTATSRVAVDQDARLLPDPGPTWEHIRDLLPNDRTPEGMQAYQYVYESPKVPVDPQLGSFAIASFPPGRPLIEACADLNERIFHEFEYDPASTTVSTPVIDVLNQKAGVCQDFAHLMISALRSLGLPARYVSGYIRPISPAIAAVAQPPQPTPAPADAKPATQATRLTPPVQPTTPEGNRGAAASHAWVAIYAGDVGWIDFDPTNRARPGHLKTDHITLAWGRDYTDVAPIKGVTFGGGAHTIDVKVEIKEA